VGAVWSIEMALSHEDSLSKYSANQRHDLWPLSGKFWRINFSRVEEKGRLNWTWCPQQVWDPVSKRFCGKVAMHLPDSWGYLVFVEETKHNDSGSHLMDPTWPHRLAAMNIYYAQKNFKSRHHKYAASIEILAPDVNQEILSPFKIELFVEEDGSNFIAVISEDSYEVTINDSRLLLVKHGQYDEQL